MRFKGKDTAAAGRFYDALGQARSHKLSAVSMDMGAAYPKVTRQRAPQAVIYWDPFHVVAMATRELDVVRRAHWNQLRATTDPATARRFKGARWALLKRPEDLSDRQADTLAALRRAGGGVWRAYALARTIRARRDGILAAVRLGISNGRAEGLNNRVRLITRRGFGFHSAAAVAALVMLSCVPIELNLPHEKRFNHDLQQLQ